jgi:hypothetical protein
MTAEEFFCGKAEWMSKEFRERRASPIDEKDPALSALRASGKAVVEEAFKGSTAEDRVVTSALTTSADGQTWEIPKMPWKHLADTEHWRDPSCRVQRDEF